MPNRNREEERQGLSSGDAFLPIQLDQFLIFKIFCPEQIEIFYQLGFQQKL